MEGPICRVLEKIRSSGCCVWTNIIYESPQRGLACLFYNLGCTIARRPWIFILIPALLSLCLCIGALWIDLETLDDVWDLYFPRDKPIASSAYKLRNTFVTSPNLTRTFCPYQTFGSSVSLPVLALTPYFGQTKRNSDTNQNASNEGSKPPVKNYGYNSLQSLCNFVKDFTYQLSPDGNKMTYEDVCAYSVGDNCLEPVLCTAIRESRDANSIKIEPEFQPLVLPKSAKVDLKTHQVLETGAFRLVWHFRSKQSNRITFSGSDNDPSAIFIRQLFDELYKVKDDLGKGEGVTFHPYSQIVQSDEVHSIVKNDSKLMVITVLLMSLFSVLVSVNKRQGVLRSRALLALAGVLTTCLAIGSAVGFLAMLGVKFIQCAFLAPFIMLGIGIDSTFVIMFTWAKECSKSTAKSTTATTSSLPNITNNPPKPTEPRLKHTTRNVAQKDKSSRDRNSRVVVSERERVIGNTMKNSFIAVFISNTTALLAFLVGSFTPYQAVNITCYYLATITFCLLLLQSSFLIGCLSLYHDMATATTKTTSSHQKTKYGEKNKKRRGKIVQTARPLNGAAMLLNGQHEQENGTEPLRGVERTQSILDGNESSLGTAALNSSHIRSNSSDQHSPNQTKLEPEHETEELPLETQGEGGEEEKVLNKLELFISGNLHKVVLSNYVRVAAVFLVGVALTLSINRVIKMRQFINEMGFQPDDSRVMDFYTLSRDLYPTDPMMVHFVIDEPIPYNDTNTRSLLDNLYRRLSENPLALKLSSTSTAHMGDPWFQLIPEKNYKKMADFIHEVQLRFGIIENDGRNIQIYMSSLLNRCHESDVLISEDGDQILRSRFVIPFEKIRSSNFDEGYSLVRDLKSATDAFPYKVYFTSTEMMLMERNSLMKESIWWSIAVAIVCCSAIAWLLLPKLFLFLTVISTLALTMTTTMGFMAIMGMHYNIATYIIVLLLIGLCIDYISHSGHAYLCASQQLSSQLNLATTTISPTTTTTSTHTNNNTSHRSLHMNDDAKREQIVRLALRNIGVPLTNAALSSLLSVSMLGFGSSYVMRNMFKSMMLLFSLSFFYGVIFLPIILSFFGPVPRNESDNSFKVARHATIDMPDFRDQEVKRTEVGAQTSQARYKTNGNLPNTISESET